LFSYLCNSALRFPLPKPTWQCATICATVTV